MSVQSTESAVRVVRERRRLAVVFSDLVDSTTIGRYLEAEDYSELLGDLRSIWHECALAHGGYVARIQGDGALVVFGYPGSSEDDCRRAVEFALDTKERVEHLTLPHALPPGVSLHLHAGIHAGTLLIAEGDIERGRFELIGDVANIAAKLSRAATAGEILVSLETLGPYANFFQLAEDRGPNTVSSLRVCSILGRADTERRFDATARRGLTPFIGRGDAVDQLMDFVTRDDAGAPRCMVLVGGPGLGKTRMLTELRRQSSPLDLVLVTGNCESYLGAELLQPYVQVLRALLDPRSTSLDGAVVGDANAVLQEIGVTADEIAAWLAGDLRKAGRLGTTTGIFDTLLSFLSRLSERRPLLLIIDDWQWADDASRRLTQALLRSARGLRCIIASRPLDDGADWISGAPHLSLGPFRGVDTERVVRRWLPHADPFLVARIHDYAGGVPLFIEELCHQIAADGLSVGRRSQAALNWVAALVTSRLERLPQDHIRVVRAAAVLGAVAPRPLLAAAAGALPDAATIRALAEADFLYADPKNDTLRFKHGITRDAIYESIGLGERQRLHERVAAALMAQADSADREESFEALAYHNRGAGHWDRAAHFADRAGDRAMGAFALDRARVLYQAALESLDRIAHRTREESARYCLIANKLGMASIFDPLSLNNDLSRFESAVAVARSLDDTATLARAKYWLGYMCYGFGRFRLALVHIRDALAGARDAGDTRLVTQIEATLGQILAGACQYDDAQALLDASIATKEKLSRPSASIAIGSAYALSCKAAILADRGDFAASEKCFSDAIGLIGGSNHPVANSIRNWRSVSLIWQGRWAEAEANATEGAGVAENMRSLLLLAACRAAAGFARWAARRDREGLQQLKDAVLWMESRRFQFFTSVQFAWLVEACAMENDVASVRRYATHVLLRARQGERLGEAATCRALARLAVLEGDSGTADRWLKRADRSAQIRSSARDQALNEALRARIRVRRAPADAVPLMADAVARLDRLGMPWHAREAALPL